MAQAKPDRSEQVDHARPRHVTVTAATALAMAFLWAALGGSYN